MTRSPFSRVAAIVCAFVAALALSGPAGAASDEAWKAFSAAVEQKCLFAVEGLVENPVAIVDPFGSESFGLALITGTLVTGTTAKMTQPVSYFCILDKETGVVELGSELSKEMLTISVAPKAPD